MTSRSLTRLFFGVRVCMFVMSLGLCHSRRCACRAIRFQRSSQNVVKLPRSTAKSSPVLQEYLVNGIQGAARDHASLILITINTPGGLDDSMRSIIQAILQSPVPVVTFVTPTGSRAASAGFFILLSADIAAMGPGTDTGAASLNHGQWARQTVQIDDTLRKKIVNEANAYLRSYVSKRGPGNADLAIHGRHRCESLHFEGSARRQADRSDHAASRPMTFSRSSTAARSLASMVRRCSSRSRTPQSRRWK